MFHSKSKTEQAQKQAALTASKVTEQLRGRVVPAVGQAAGTAVEWGQPRVHAAREWGQPHVEAARDWAKPRVGHGIEVAGPRLEQAVSGLAPHVDTARDKIVEEMLPRAAEAISALSAAAAAAASSEAQRRGSGAASVLSGKAVAKPRRRKGKLLLLLGLLAAAGAAAAVFVKKTAPKDDPWAAPLSEPYLSPTDAAGVGEGQGDVDAVSADVDESTAALPDTTPEDLIATESRNGEETGGTRA